MSRPMLARRRSGPAAAGLCCLVLTSCSTVADGHATGPQRCPAAPLAPAADRPVIDVDFDLDPAGTTVSGTETVRFTPDLSTAELVFRLTPNQPASAAAGNELRVSGVTGDDVGGRHFDPAGAAAGTPGGLLVVDLDRTLHPGEQTIVTLTFELTLGSGAFDRFGHEGTTSWWGSGQPLLAWEPGRGWAREPMSPIVAETATSSAAVTTVSVTAPRDLTVLMTGLAASPADVGHDRRRWRAEATAARDVSVAVGEFATASTDVGGVVLTVGTLGDRGADELLGTASAALRSVSGLLGDYPFPSLTVADLGNYGGGIEYPSSILLASSADLVLTHEVAHMWFYGMLGDDQARDPWLDEALATYVELVVDTPAGQVIDTSALQRPGDVGSSLADFGDDAAQYYSTVYGKGSAALIAAREAAGADRFDAAIRCYLKATAWQIAIPRDIRRALVDLPEALEILQRAGAL